MKPAKFFAVLAALGGLAAFTPSSGNAGAPECVRTYAQGHSEFLVNACDTCRRVAITHRRYGSNGSPAMRTYDLQPKSKFPLPFKGAGRSRVTSDVPCRDEAGGGQDLLNPGKGRREEAPKTCVSLQSTARNGVVLVNQCGGCRAAAVVRYAANGQSMGREFFKVLGRGVVPVPAKGAAKVGYLADVDCPS
ncbi:MAG: hypothetical protein VW338_04515 [Rhodospirillaceae bacterium]|jgi:hypothetical protein